MFLRFSNLKQRTVIAGSGGTMKGAIGGGEARGLPII
jgi:hypothetical protein